MIIVPVWLTLSSGTYVRSAPCAKQVGRLVGWLVGSGIESPKTPCATRHMTDHPRLPVMEAMLT